MERRHPNLNHDRRNWCEMDENITIRRGERHDIPTLVALSVEARTRYSAVEGFEYIAGTKPVPKERFLEGETLVAVTPMRAVLGFAE